VLDQWRDRLANGRRRGVLPNRDEVDDLVRDLDALSDAVRESHAAAR
jgi:hypothetical protein